MLMTWRAGKGKAEEENEEKYKLYRIEARKPVYCPSTCRVAETKEVALPKPRGTVEYTRSPQFVRVFLSFDESASRLLPNLARNPKPCACS